MDALKRIKEIIPENAFEMKKKKKTEEKKPGLKVKLGLVLFGGLWTTRPCTGSYCSH